MKPTRSLILASALALLACSSTSGSTDPQGDAAPAPTTTDAPTSTPPTEAGVPDGTAKPPSTDGATPPPPADASGDAQVETCGPLIANGEEILDTTTGVRWAQHIVPSTGNFRQVSDYCDRWPGRLPTKDEALAMVKTGYRQCSFFDGPFDRRPVWTGTPYTQPGFFYVVNFDNGGIDPMSQDDSTSARCVRK